MFFFQGRLVLISRLCTHDETKVNKRLNIIHGLTSSFFVITLIPSRRILIKHGEKTVDLRGNSAPVSEYYEYFAIFIWLESANPGVWWHGELSFN